MKKNYRYALLTSAIALSAHKSYKYFAKKIIDKHFRSKRCDSNQKIEDFLPSEKIKNIFLNDLENYIAWFRNCDKETLNLTSYDGLKLAGIWLKNKEKAPTIILCHGYRSARYILLKQAYEFNNLGYNILMIDPRGYGESEGESVTYGLKESVDLAQWINLLVSKDPDIQLILYGLSLGAETVCMCLGNKLPTNVKSAIVEGAYYNLKELAKTWYKADELLAKPLTFYLNLELLKRFGFGFDAVDASKALANNEIPICFIHSKIDKAVPYEQGLKLYHANKGKKYFYPLENAYHSYGCYEEDYFKVLVDFIKEFTKLDLN